MYNRWHVLAHFLLTAVLGAGAHAGSLSECAKGSEPLSALAADQVVILGDLHGTVETPLIAGAHVCALLHAGRKVLLALEVPQEEQDRIEAFLASSGDVSDERQLLAGSHWTKAVEHQDGRSSGGMLALLELARRLAQATGRLKLLAFDQWQDSTPRDELMAKNIEAAIKGLPGFSVVVLVGNIHAVGTRGTPFDSNFESMAYHLRDRGPLSINVVPTSGEAWFCRPTCGVHPLMKLPAASRDTVLKFGESPMPGFTGTLFLPRATASPPAVHGGGTQ